MLLQYLFLPNIRELKEDSIGAYKVLQCPGLKSMCLHKLLQEQVLVCNYIALSLQ
jgi:hypothetical protein